MQPTDYYKKEFSIEEVEKLLKDDLAVDATYGGFVSGRLHDEGGIYFLVKNSGKYILEGELEGFEFILNIGATQYYQKSTHIFHDMDEYQGQKFEEYQVKDKIKKIETNRLPYPKYLIFDYGGFSIINKFSTKDYLDTLDVINKAVTFEVIDDTSLKFVHHVFNDIPILKSGRKIGYLPAPIIKKLP